MNDMMGDLASKTHRREVNEIPIAPILDMLVAIIFFLLLSTTFVTLTGQIVPPARVSTIRDPLTPPPNNPKLIVLREAQKLIMTLTWEGLTPGQWRQEVAVSNDADIAKPTLEAALSLIRALKNQYPTENTIQLGFGKNAIYQDVISTMDGVRKLIPDVVLISSHDAEAEATNRK